MLTAVFFTVVSFWKKRVETIVSETVVSNETIVSKVIKKNPILHIDCEIETIVSFAFGRSVAKSSKVSKSLILTEVDVKNLSNLPKRLEDAGWQEKIPEQKNKTISRKSS